MTRSEIDLIRHAIELLHKVVAYDEPRAGNPAPRNCPVTMFVKHYLTTEPASDVATAELWRFFSEIVAARELTPLTKQVFLRQLSAVMESVFGVRKSHNIERTSRRVRGFRGVGIRLETCPPVTL